MAEKEEQVKKEKTEEQDENKDMMIPEETYLTSGVHIGTRQKTSDIQEFLYKVRNDGLYIINIEKTDERIKKAAKLIAKYNPENILAVSVRLYGQKPVSTMSKYTGINTLEGRFQPGTLTNPSGGNFLEPDMVIVTDPLADQQALQEAKNVGIPVVALCDSNNQLRYVDLAIPTNNKGRRALALVYWLLTRAILKEQGKIESYDDFEPEIEDFEAEI
ncbi:MAG: 30S ribosomal protein S2 [Candidatus Thermoplasmatota archaeon]